MQVCWCALGLEQGGYRNAWSRSCSTASAIALRSARPPNRPPSRRGGEGFGGPGAGEEAVDALDVDAIFARAHVLGLVLARRVEPDPYEQYADLVDQGII